MADRGGHDGAVLVADNATGDVLAYVGASGGLASAPHVDSVRARRQAGSTLKPFTALAGLTYRAIAPGTTFRDPCFGYYQFGRRRFGCWDKDGHGWTALRQAVARS